MLKSAITGLGMAGLTRTDTQPVSVLAVNGIREAIADAGLGHGDIDGLILSRSGAAHEKDPDLDLHKLAGLRDLKLLQLLHGEGTSAVQMVQTASLAVSAGLATNVVCVFADAPLQPGLSAREAFANIKSVQGLRGLRYTAGLFGGAALYAMAARRHMALYGTTQEQLGAVAVSTRRWAQMNPRALLKKPMSLDDYLASRWIAEPLRLFDCAMPVNGAIAVLVSAADRAKDMRQPPVHVRGFGQGHRGEPEQRGFDGDVRSGAALARDTAFRMAGIGVSDVDICQIYDAFTYMTLVMLEDYGFCKKGEGGAFVESGAIAPGGALPTNTGGGHLSGYYLQGMTPVSEAIIQARGQAGERQCAKRDIMLATNEGGRFEYHGCLVLSPHAAKGAGR